jgi:Family of unknown function (DUF6221)
VDVVEFLKARLDEDEKIAGESREWGVRHHDCADPVWDVCEQPCEFAKMCAEGRCTHVAIEGDDGMRIYDEGGHDVVDAAHIARHDPARVLRAVDAKRAVLRLHMAEPGQHPDFCGHDLRELPCPTPRLLASEYSDHPDYKQEWNLNG